MNEKIFYTDDLAVGYSKKIVLDGVNISAEKGKIVTLIGPNGAGKSTLLKTAAKLLPPVSGAVYIDGRDVSAISGGELAKKLSLLVTERVAPELATCKNVVEFGRYPYTGQMGILSEHDKKIIDEAMEITNSKGLSDALFSRVSDGQKQRVMLARAICQEPEILILDEPAAYLDIRYKIEVLNILKRLASEKNIAIIMSLHELDMARKISDTVVCVKDGKVWRVGNAEEIFRDGCIAELYEIEPKIYRDYFAE